MYKGLESIFFLYREKVVIGLNDKLGLECFGDRCLDRDGCHGN